MRILLSEGETYLLSAKERNFYARVLVSLIHVEVPRLGTFAVGINNAGQYVLYYDPVFLEQISFQEFVLTLEHEVLHIILGHIPRFIDIISGLVLPEEKQKFRAAINISADCAANELLRLEPHFDKTYGAWFYGSEATEGRSFLTPEAFDLKRNQPFEVYLFQLVAKMKKSSQKFLDSCKTKLDSGGSPEGGAEQPGAGQSGAGQAGAGGSGKAAEPSEPREQTPEALVDAYFEEKTGGRHRFWTHGADEEQGNSEELQGLADKLQQEGRNIVRSAVQEQVKSRGTVPAGLQELIAQLLAVPTIPWPRVLRSLCTRTQQSKRSRGMRRPSRRLYGVPGILPFPGASQDHRFHLLFAVDTSGSMDQNDLALALRELLNIVKTEPDVTLTVMQCDAVIQMTYKVEREEDVDFTVKGRGGTNFNPPFIKVRELLRGDSAPDILIYATDMEAPPPRVENRVPIPVIWLATPRSKPPKDGYGMYLEMEPSS